MKNDIILVKPNLALKEKALNYRKEHFQHGETIIYGSELFDKTESYEEWLSSVTLNTNPETVNENWVVTDTFFAIRKSDDKIIGIIDLRHTLIEFLIDIASIKVIQKNGGVYERSFSFENEAADIYKIEL